MQNKINIDPGDLETLLAASKGADSFLQYTVSNEHYGRRLDDFLGSIQGLNGYIGIAGGGTQQFYFLGALNHNNRLQEALFLDINPIQLANLSKIIQIYNDSKDENECLQKFSKYYSKLGGLEGDLEHEGYFGFPNIEYDLPARLKIADINHYFSSEEQKVSGKYFIYLSNVLDAEWARDGPKMVLDSIFRNPNIEPGSIVLIVRGAFHSSALALKKGDDGRPVVAFDDKS